MKKPTCSICGAVIIAPLSTHPLATEWVCLKCSGASLSDFDGCDGDTETALEVYARDECIFNYCDAPDICKPQGRCRHARGER